LCYASAYIMTLGRKRLKHISGTIIYDSRITSDGETRVARDDDGTYSRYLYLPRVSDLYELKSRSLFIIYRAIASLIKPITLPVIKSPFEFIEYRLKIAWRWHTLIRIFCTYCSAFSIQTVWCGIDAGFQTLETGRRFRQKKIHGFGSRAFWGQSSLY